MFNILSFCRFVQLILHCKSCGDAIQEETGCLYKQVPYFLFKIMHVSIHADHPQHCTSKII